MKRYVQVTSVFFSVLSLLQLTRTILGWPVQVAGVDIPTWVSLVLALVTGAFAAWGFRTSQT